MCEVFVNVQIVYRRAKMKLMNLMQFDSLLDNLHAGFTGRELESVLSQNLLYEYYSSWSCCDRSEFQVNLDWEYVTHIIWDALFNGFEPELKAMWFRTRAWNHYSAIKFLTLPAENMHLVSFSWTRSIALDQLEQIILIVEEIQRCKELCWNSWTNWMDLKQLTRSRSCSYSFQFHLM